MSPEKIHPENSDDRSARAGGSGGAATGGNAEIHDRTGLYVSLIALIFSSFALMGYFWAYSEMQLAQQAARAAQNRADAAMLRTEGFTRALIAKGIDPYPHLRGEDQ